MNRDSVRFAQAASAISAVLFVLALVLPLVDMRVVTRFSTSTVFTGPQMLAEAGISLLGMIVLLTLVVFPALKIAIQLMVFFGVEATYPSRLVPWLFALLERVSHWAMVEVYLLGSFVAYTRLRALSPVDIGPALFALGGVMLLMVAIDATLDREAIWQAIEAKRAPRRGEQRDSFFFRRRPTGPLPPPILIGCHSCGKVTHAAEGQACERCYHPLHARKRQPTATVWALLLTAGFLYIPANVLPVMTVVRFGKGGPKTILGGIVELAQDHLWGLAALVLVASVIVPILKVLSLAFMLVMTQRRSGRRLRERTQLFRFVQAIGRWSMIDIFMLAVLVGVVRFGFLATVTPGLGAMAFCSVVLVTMVATEAFDPRWMWDAAQSVNEPAPAEGIRS